MNGEVTAILSEGRNCWRLEEASRGAFLIDAAAYYRAFAAAVERARESILIAAWDIDSRVRLIRDGEEGGEARTLDAILRSAVARRKGLHVHILDWDFAMIFSLEREIVPLFNLPWRRPKRIHFQLDGVHPVGACHHQKIVVLDDRVAFVGGIDLTKKRWDTTEHLPEDPRRVDPSGRAYEPFHDVQMLVEGPVAAALGDLVRERWARATGVRPGPPDTPESNPWPPGVDPDLGSVQVGISRTEPAFQGREEVREVETLYRDAVAAARRFIYIENQYFTSRTMAKALGERLQEQDGPEILIVLPRKASDWLEESTMGVLRARALNYLREQDAFGRLQVRYPAVEGLGAGRINVHSKVLVIDETLARVGSSNLNSRSMGVDSECDLTVEAKGDPAVRGAVASLRNRLLAEHLGASSTAVGEALGCGGSLAERLEGLAAPGRSLQPMDLEDMGWIDGWIQEAPAIDPEEPIDPARIIGDFLPEEVRRDGKGRLLRWFFAAVGLLASAAALRWSPLGRCLGPETLLPAASWLQETGAAPFIVLSAYLLGNLLMVPATLMIVGTAFVFGPGLGMAYSLSGCMAGAGGGYLIGRVLGRNRVGRVAGWRLNRISRRLARHGVFTMILVRLLPLAPFPVVNLAAGAMQIRMRDFFLGTMIGTAPVIAALSVLEALIEEVCAHPDAGNLFLLVLLSTAILAGLLLLRRWARLDPPSSGSAGKTGSGFAQGFKGGGPS